jgi:RND superfamily putative drug exporter
VDGDYDQARTRAAQLRDRYAVTGATITASFGGFEPIQSDLISQSDTDLRVTEAVAVPIILILLVLAFGSVTAGVLPLIVGGIAIAGTCASLWAFASVTDVSLYALNLTTSLGLGLAIDYSLLVVSRYREEIAAGRDEETALRRTVDTAGRTIAFSAAIVACGLATLAIFPLYYLRSFSYAGVAVVVIAALGAVLTLPAILRLLGPARLERFSWRRGGRPGSRFWERFALGVMRHPVRTGLPVAALLVACGLGFLQIDYWYPNDTVLPASSPSRQTGDQIRANFAGDADSTVTVVLTGPLGAGALTAYAKQVSDLQGISLVRSAAGTFAAGEPVTAAAPPAGGFPRGAYLTVSSTTDPYSAAGEEVVHRIRALPAPAPALVTGDAAMLVDVKAAIADRLPLALIIIVLTTFVLLFLFTGSVIVPVKALLLNFLNLAAVMGALVWIFQYGHGAGLLGITPGPIAVAMPILLFCVVFGLSMDYEVFLIARIKEKRDQGHDMYQSVALGLGGSARIVTTAAALLSVTFFALAFAKISFIKWFGVGAGLAIVIDATLIRLVLVPALMRAMGEANWWAPGPLRRLHDRIGPLEGGPPAPIAAQPSRRHHATAREQV